MQQYLLNASAIWLISLVLFDAFLRKESYHNYNRFYLLFTFLLGALLPLWQWQSDGIYTTTTLEKPLERVMAVKQNIVAATVPDNTMNLQQWLTIIYLSGVFIALCLLAVDIVKLVALYSKGQKLKQNGWTVIETGKEHAPFSLFNCLFVNSAQQYSPDEWGMILVHERRHNTLFHFADLLLMQIARIILWFHPLVYLYNKRLLLVHEYQADNASAQQPRVYGTFLVAQSVLQSAPALSHSFNRSPIKNRIIMLTHRSSSASKSKMLLFIPLTLVCVGCFSKNSFSQKFEKNGDIVTYRGNKFELTKAVYDTVILVDPVDGHEITKVTEKDPSPIKMNGAKIYRTDEVKPQPAFYIENGSLDDYIFKGVSQELDQLPDGAYHLDIYNIVVDGKGKVVYYEYRGLNEQNNSIKIPADIEKALNEKIDPLMNAAPAFSPGKANGNTVPVRLDIFLSMDDITVNDHKATIHKR